MDTRAEPGNGRPNHHGHVVRLQRNDFTCNFHTVHHSPDRNAAELTTRVSQLNRRLPEHSVHMHVPPAAKNVAPIVPPRDVRIELCVATEAVTRSFPPVVV